MGVIYVVVKDVGPFGISYLLFRFSLTADFENIFLGRYDVSVSGNTDRDDLLQHTDSECFPQIADVDMLLKGIHEIRVFQINFFRAGDILITAVLLVKVV